MFSSPPTNHLANGGFDQSSVWSHFLAQVSRSAWVAQKARRSAAASSYASAFTLAAAASASGGGNCRLSDDRFANVSLMRAAPLSLLTGHLRCTLVAPVGTGDTCG